LVRTVNTDENQSGTKTTPGINRNPLKTGLNPLRNQPGEEQSAQSGAHLSTIGWPEG